MIKPRVIIADSDVNYVMPLQSRFIEEYADGIELEIITDKQYLDELFLSPQRALLLVISEKMFSESFAKHGIEHIFLLTENAFGDETTDPSAERVFKYTSVKEIFNRIVSTCFRDVDEQLTDSKYTRVIAVCSGKGGQGKTTVALGIAGYLAQNYKRVLYLNAAELQTFHVYMENVTPITDAEIYVKLRSTENSVYKELKSFIRKEHFYYLPPFKAPLFSMGIDQNIYVDFIKEVRQSLEYDYIIIDVNTGFNEYLMNVLNLADNVIFVTEQDEASALAMNRVAENIGGIGTNKYLFVCNKYDGNNPNAHVERRMNLKYSIATYIDMVQDNYEMRVADFIQIRGVDKLAYHII